MTRARIVDGRVVAGTRSDLADVARLNHLLDVVDGHGTMAEARESAGLSVGQAERVTGISRERLVALEGGAVPTRAELATLCEAYDVAGFAGPVERPIILGGPWVRAILDGQKTVTRRPLTPQPEFVQIYEWQGRVLYEGSGRRWFYKGHALGEVCCNDSGFSEVLVPLGPFGRPGDRLWVREAWATLFDSGGASEDTTKVPEYEGGNNPSQIIYRADEKYLASVGWKWRPSIHLPRWAARLVLEIVSVRVERLHAIDDEDARREGVLTLEPRAGATSPRELYAEMWSATYPRAPWASNPWVWRCEFRVVEGGRDG